MLLLASSVCGLFKWRQFEPEVILLAVGWYLRFSLSTVTWRNSLPSADFWSITVWRWVQRYAPEMERRLRSRLEPTNDSWRMDFDLHPGQGQVGVFVARWTPPVRLSTGSPPPPLLPRMEHSWPM